MATTAVHDASDVLGLDGMSAARVLVAGKSWAMRREALEELWQLHGHVLSPFEAREKPKAEPVGGVSVVSLKGVITPGTSLLGLLFGGGFGLNAFVEDLELAVADKEVKAVVLEVDSPGGLVDQVPETADRVRELRKEKPIVAVSNTCCASAAYWIASQAHEVVVTKSGEVGSVGVYAIHIDESAALEQEGVRPTIVSAGQHKAEGNPFEPLDDAARAFMQEGVNDFYEMFVRDVSDGRGVGMPKLDGLAFGGGRMYTRDRAVDVKLADRVATLDETVARLSKPEPRPKVRRVGEEWDEPEPEPTPTADPYTKEERLRLLDVLVPSG